MKLILMTGILGLSVSSSFASHALSCWAGCSIRGRIHDKGNEIRIHLWNDSSIMDGFLPAELTTALVDAEVIFKPELEIKDLHFSIPKKDCKLHSNSLGILDCKAPSIALSISGEIPQGWSVNMTRVVERLELTGVQVQTTTVSQEYTDFNLKFRFQTGSIESEYEQFLTACKIERRVTEE